MKWVGSHPETRTDASRVLPLPPVVSTPIPILIVLAPGCAHLYARHTQAGQLFAGSHLSALAIAVLGWGTPLGVCMATVAFCLHVVAVSDAIALISLPPRPPWRIRAVVGCILGCFVYAPALNAALLFADPVQLPCAANECYLVNRKAYESKPPLPGDWIWHHASSADPGRMARVLAGPGQTAELISGTWRVEGRSLSWARQGRNHPLQDFVMRIPADRLLVWHLDGSSRIRLRLLPITSVQGQVWFRQFPFRSRGFMENRSDATPTDELAMANSSLMEREHGTIDQDWTYHPSVESLQNARPSLGPLASPVYSREFL